MNKKTLTKTFHAYKIVVTLDKGEVYENDPGSGTPEMVSLFENGREIATGTLNCVLGEGEIEGMALDAPALKFLDECAQIAENFLYNT